MPRFLRKLARHCARLARDNGGNVIMIVAASLFPLLAIVGSGIDMGRGYLAESRLQQACDAGTLAARKRLGTMAAVNGTIPASVADTGQRFFNINFRDGAYSAENRRFVMELEADLAISGIATADVPTTIMGVFGFDSIRVSAACVAQINMSNTDIMMVLDTTGSMQQTNRGDSVNRIQALRNTVRSFHAQMEANKTAGTRIRYGFVPYSTNVNVGGLLDPDWLVDEWRYNYRVAQPGSRTETRPTYETAWTFISGAYTDIASSVGPTCPANTTSWTLNSRTVDASGWTHEDYTVNGNEYWCNEVDTGTFQISGRTYNNYRFRWSWRQNGTETYQVGEWRYGNFRVDLSFLETSNSTSVRMGGNPTNPDWVTATYRGCVEERDTYEITDYNNVNLDRALDLNLDRVPTEGDPSTQWRPMINELSFIREIRTNGRGSFTPATVTTSDEFVNAWWWGLSACPSPARRLAEMTASEVSTYVDSLVAQGSTYHDIGMIWGGRLLSPTGLFAADNADLNGRATSRHLIFMTDGETAPLDVSYGAYGIEPLDRRRWSPSSAMTLTQTVENRFSFACNEVKRRNITVWVVSFGTAPNPIMEACSGADRYFVAANAAELEQAFTDIARRMGELRLVD